MHGKIMVPVDRAHIERLDKAIATATDLAVASHAAVSVLVVR